ncbi:hypothetical protein EV182_004794 [Spiromyces aspiralis]|uniref:Uncharacterized protein n=1 Tax=Spiromyces aspiralis TaxID=68401 RepID=A0ACC1HDF7_9FUNG|nr:hypothetical protein EV182_004794 [Spiromyces aspiralis]
MGIDSSTASNLLLVFNGCVAVGRIAAGLMSDKIGPVLTYLVGNTVSFVAIFAHWYPAKSFGVFAGFATLYGLFCSTFVSVNPTIVASLFGVNSLGSSLGLLCLFTSCGILIGIPLQGKIYDDIDHRRRFRSMVLFSGFLYLAASASYLALWALLTVRVARRDGKSMPKV